MTKGTGFGKALPKNFRKVKSGYDQAFTLPKGTSAAPIKQATSYKPKKKLSKTDAFLGGSAIGILATEQFGKPGKTTKKPITKKGWGKAYKRGG